MRILLFFMMICAGTLVAQAQDVPSKQQQTGTGGNVVVIEDAGKPQNGNGTGTGTAQPAKPTKPEARPETQAASSEPPAKVEGKETPETPKVEVSKTDSVAKPAGPRVRKVYKKDTSRRVVLRRRAKGGAPTNVAREQREGYRIQIFTGGNRRQDRQRAEQLGEKIKEYFPELSTYSHFACPRWTCRVGDFEKPEEANRYVSLILRSKVSYEARVIKCLVWLPKK